MENTNEKVVDTQDFAEDNVSKCNNAPKALLNDKPKRNAGIDLLRVLSMFMVVVLHVSGYQNYSGTLQQFSLSWYLMSVLDCLIIVAVNCFGLITGYVNSGKKYNLKNIINLWLQVVCICVLSTVAFYFIHPSTVTVKDIIYSFLPVYSKQYWYFSAYFLLFFFIPLLNIILRETNKKLLFAVLGMIGVLTGCLASLTKTDIFVLGSGYSTIWLMYLYLLGGAIKKHGLCIRIKGKPIKPYWYLLGFFCVSLLNFAFAYIRIKLERNYAEAFIGNYNFILNTLSAVCLLLFFANLKVKSNKFISILGITSFGVYLIHEQHFIKQEFICGKFTFLQTLNPFVAILTIIGISIAIYVICTVIEYLRQLLFKLLRIPKFTAWIQEKIENLYHKIGSKKSGNEADNG